MQNSTNQGVDQHYHVQVAVDQDSVRIVGASLSHHPNDQAEAAPPLDSMPPEIGTPDAAALDAGSLSAATITRFESRHIAPDIAPGRDPHHPRWRERCAAPSPSLPDDASPQSTRAYKLKTVIGQALYSARTETVEPVLGIITEVLGFRQCSLRGAPAAAGEWCLVCRAFHLKRLHPLLQGSRRRWTAAAVSVNGGGCLPDAPT
jgi:hypothetical protein